MKKIIKLLTIILSLCLFAGCFVGCTPNESDGDSNDKLTYVSLRINPEIEIVADEDGKVVAVNAINEDGETVLLEISIIGKTVEDAAEEFADMATELGYVDVESQDNTVYISVDGEVTAEVEKIKNKIEIKVNGYFENRGIYGKVAFESFEELQTLATQLGVDLNEAKIIDRVSKLYPEMTIEEIKALTFEEKIALIKDNREKNGIPVSLSEEYKQLVDALNLQFENMFEIEEQINAYKEQINDLDISDVEKQAIQSILDSLSEQLKTLEGEYKVALEQIKQQVKLQLETVEREMREDAQSRREQNKRKLEEHQNDFENRKEQIKEDIKNWREGR